MQDDKTVIFMVTNGAGLGHLTRGLAVARRLKQMDPKLNIIFFSTSLATEVIRETGFMFFYIPTKAIMPSSMTNSTWNEYLGRQLNEILDIYHPVALVYDGAYPYKGLLSSLGKKKIKSIWIKRECYKEGIRDLGAIESLFNLVIVPKEISSMQVIGTPRKKYCEPIMFLDKEEAHEREQIRKQLNITDKHRLYYIQLGAGVINETDSLLNHIVKIVLKDENNRIMLGESIIGKKSNIYHPHIFIIRSYPNAQYFKALDIAISAAGYNTFHELLYFGIPTVFVPNMKTSMDDQLARIQQAVKRNACLCLQENERCIGYEETINKANVLSESLKVNAQQLITKNGAIEAAGYINEFINDTM